MDTGPTGSCAVLSCTCGDSSVSLRYPRECHSRGLGQMQPTSVHASHSQAASVSNRYIILMILAIGMPSTAPPSLYRRCTAHSSSVHATTAPSLVLLDYKSTRLISAIIHTLLGEQLYDDRRRRQHWNRRKHVIRLRRPTVGFERTVIGMVYCLLRQQYFRVHIAHKNWPAISHDSLDSSNRGIVVNVSLVHNMRRGSDCYCASMVFGAV